MPTYGALWLDSEGAFASVPHAAPLDLTGQTATIECWVKGRTAINTVQLVGKASTTLTGWGMRFDGSGRLAFYANVTGSPVVGAYGGSSVMDGTWHHVACVKSAAGMVSYVDGGQVATGVQLAGVSLVSNAFAVNFNGNTGGNHVNGVMLAEVRIWNTARTVAEILAMRDVYAVGNESGLVGCWHLNDNTGTTAADAANGNTAALTLHSWVTPAVPPWAAAVGSSGQPAGIPALLWEGDTTGPALIAHAADFYVVTISPPAAGVARTTVPFGTYYPDIGRIALLGTANAVRETQRISYGLNEIWPHIRPAEQLYLDVLPGIACHTQAWTLT